MIKCKGYIDSIYSGSAVDGKGLRVVVFFSGCNMTCPFCHNPETLYKKGEEYTVESLVNRIKRYSAYIKRGGVTLSGGEPFLQSEFIIALNNELANNGIKVAIETNGHIIDKAVIESCEYLICDVKNQETDDLTIYHQFLTACKECGKKVELTCVIVPTVNDVLEKINALKKLRNEFSETVFNLRLLPFRKLCVEKYKKLDKHFLYEHKEECDKSLIEKLNRIIQE